MSTKRVPKRFAQPTKGFTVETEPDDIKGARLLAMFRWAADTGHWGFGFEIGGAQFMVVRYRPQPHGPHNPHADVTEAAL